MYWFEVFQRNRGGWYLQQQKPSFIPLSEIWKAIASFYIDFRFIIVPMFVLISAFAIPKWAREKIVIGVQNTITFLGNSFLLVSEFKLERNVGKNH